MNIPDPGTYVRITYVKPREGGVVGEEGEIISISSETIKLEFQPKRRKQDEKDPPVVKSTVAKHEILRVEKINAK